MFGLFIVVQYQMRNDGCTSGRILSLALYTAMEINLYTVMEIWQ